MRVRLLRMCAKELKNVFFCRKYTCESGALNGFNPGAGDLGWKDLMEKGKATHSSILAWRIPWTV